MWGLSKEVIQGLQSITLRHTEDIDRRLKQAKNFYVQVLTVTGTQMTLESDSEYQSDSDSDEE